jgi:hypothetical protein
VSSAHDQQLEPNVLPKTNKMIHHMKKAFFVCVLLTCFTTIHGAGIFRDSTMYKYPETARILKAYEYGHMAPSRAEKRVLRREMKYQIGQATSGKGNPGDTWKLIAVIALALGALVGSALIAGAVATGSGEILGLLILFVGIIVAVSIATYGIRNIHRK